jgi:hypothetical protein
MLRFLMRTADVARTRWQIHSANCLDVQTLLRNGASVEVASAKSARAIILDELSGAINERFSEADFAIMTCCRD